MTNLKRTTNMQELQAFNSERIYWAVEQVEQEAGGIADLHLDDELFYIKSDVEKALASKDKEIAKLKEQVALLQAEFVPTEGEQ